MREIDWRVLKVPIMLMVGCLIVCAILIIESYYFKTSLGERLKKERHLLQSASKQYLEIDRGKFLLDDYYSEFIKLNNDGVIGSENRLRWIESLNQSGERAKLPELKYSISSQAEYHPDFQIQYDGYKLYKSSMTLNMGLSHEENFLNFLEELDRLENGIYTITSCRFRMNGSQILFRKGHVNIIASCVLDWITINMENGEELHI